MYRYSIILTTNWLAWAIVLQPYNKNILTFCHYVVVVVVDDVGSASLSSSSSVAGMTTVRPLGAPSVAQDVL